MELIRAAYGIVLEAKATAVFANDRQNLRQKFAVTKERGVHPMEQKDLAEWIWEMLNDEYYSTVPSEAYAVGEKVEKTRALISAYADHFTHTEAGIIFGTVAVRCGSGFVTTGRGKRELDSITLVDAVNHTLKVVSASKKLKASLNAPLLARMFDNPAVDYIVHYHEQVPGLPTYPYAPPGTVRDSIRPYHQVL